VKILVVGREEVKINFHRHFGWHITLSLMNNEYLEHILCAMIH
jgi:hypothetical protein